jgi:hypothetical protein
MLTAPAVAVAMFVTCLLTGTAVRSVVRMAGCRAMVSAQVKWPRSVAPVKRVPRMADISNGARGLEPRVSLTPAP